MAPATPSIAELPNEILFHVLGFLDVSDLLSTSRVSQQRPPGCMRFRVGCRVSRASCASWPPRFFVPQRRWDMPSHVLHRGRIYELDTVACVELPNVHPDQLKPAPGSISPAPRPTATDRAPQVNHHLRYLSLTPLLHARRLRDNRAIVTPLLTSPARPTRSDLVARSIVQPRTSAVSRRLARSLTCIRLSRRLAARPSAQALVERAVLPRECVPGLAGVHVAPGLVARRRAVERERVRDGLRGFVGAWGEEVCRGRGRVS